MGLFANESWNVPLGPVPPSVPPSHPLYPAVIHTGYVTNKYKKPDLCGVEADTSSWRKLPSFIHLWLNINPKMDLRLRILFEQVYRTIYVTNRKKTLLNPIWYKLFSCRYWNIIGLLSETEKQQRRIKRQWSHCRDFLHKPHDYFTFCKCYSKTELEYFCM